MQAGRIGFKIPKPKKRMTLVEMLEQEGFDHDTSVVMAHYFHKGKFNSLGYYVQKELNNDQSDYRDEIFKIALEYERQVDDYQ